MTGGMIKVDSARILIVEDDSDISRLLCALLSKNGYAVTAAYSGSEAELRLSQTPPYDLVLLDLMLPGIAGEELLTTIRRDQVMPVIVLSAKGQQDKLHVLGLGADDYITKPFDLREVLARVAAQLRRYQQFTPPVQKKKVLCYRQLMLDTEGAAATIQGATIPLTARELGILALLMAHPQKVFTRANLFESVWGEPFVGDDNTVNVHISNLRAKLARADPGTTYIKTVWGIGFKMQDL